MKTYIALLRGINVGGNCKVEMPKLKKTFESMGFSDVATYINSGNVIFKSNKEVTSQYIEKVLSKEFGFEIKTLVISGVQLKKIARAIPSHFTNDTELRTDVLFLWKDFDKKSTIKLIKINPDVDNLKYVSGAIIWNLKRSDYGKSRMNKLIGTVVYKNMTGRNVNTVRKLAEMMK